MKKRNAAGQFAAGRRSWSEADWLDAPRRTGISESGTLHRVGEALVRREVEAAGFRLAAEGNFLRNPNDPRDRNTPDPPQPKDEFVLKFV